VLLGQGSGREDVLGSIAQDLRGHAQRPPFEPRILASPSDLEVRAAARHQTDAQTEWFSQPFPKAVHVDRDASLMVFDRNRAAIPSGVVEVRAGTSVGFWVRFKFHADRQRGPFVVSMPRQSDPGIRHGNGSTTRIDLGYWSPGTSMGDSWVTYDVAANLRGKEGWIQLQLIEGGTPIHIQMVYLKIL
jgi:hypothetical protein